MKKLVIFSLLFFSCVYIIAQQTLRSFTWDGTTREYLEYLPQTYNPEIPAPVIFCLHGLGDNMYNFSGVGFEEFADNIGWIVITPQALVASVPTFGEIGAAWNSGAGGNFPLIGNTFPNENVDDSGFLMAILDSLENHYNIDTDSVFFMGFSMGGFMCHRMAIEHGDRITGIAAVSGTIGNGIIDQIPQYPLNVLHIHGTDDSVVGYVDAGFFVGIESVSIGLGAEQTVDFWKTNNNCNNEAIITYFPDIKDDGKTFERYLYTNGDNNVNTALIKVINGVHELYYYPQNDIDYVLEIYKFFTRTMDFPSSISYNDIKNKSIIYPNPAKNKVYINKSNCELSFYDVVGQIKKKTKNSNPGYIDIADLNSGIYIVKISSLDGEYVVKMIIEK